jgi:hypothetical protein
VSHDDAFPQPLSVFFSLCTSLLVKASEGGETLRERTLTLWNSPPHTHTHLRLSFHLFRSARSTCPESLSARRAVVLFFLWLWLLFFFLSSPLLSSLCQSLSQPPFLSSVHRKKAVTTVDVEERGRRWKWSAKRRIAVGALCVCVCVHVSCSSPQLTEGVTIHTHSPHLTLLFSKCGFDDTGYIYNEEKGRTELPRHCRGTEARTQK